MENFVLFLLINTFACTQHIILCTIFVGGISYGNAYAVYGDHNAIYYVKFDLQPNLLVILSLGIAHVQHRCNTTIVACNVNRNILHTILEIDTNILSP
jgi:hypothetical protein